MDGASTAPRVMSLQKHLRELRRRILLIAVALIGGCVVGFLLSEPLWVAIQAPIERVGEEHSQLANVNFPTVSAAFDLRLQLAITLAVIITAPFWLYQVLAFIVPGLLSRERRYLFAFLGIAVPLFLGGCFAGWWVTPHIVEVMLGFLPSNSSALIDAKTLFEFVLKLMLATGIAFVLPVFLVILNLIGLVSGTAILHSWRWAIVAITAFTAVATPAADVLSMFLLALPMCLLFFSACGVALLHDRRSARKASLLASGIGKA